MPGADAPGMPALAAEPGNCAYKNNTSLTPEKNSA